MYVLTSIQIKLYKVGTCYIFYMHDFLYNFNIIFCNLSQETNILQRSIFFLTVKLMSGGELYLVCVIPSSFK